MDSVPQVPAGPAAVLMQEEQCLMRLLVAGADVDGKAAPGISANTTLEALAEQWGTDPRWQVGTQ